ncbi:MAG: hypothetical protein ABIC91_00215 [Nanoarchaeota archaeon]|nr:hypothetical protein [Nanoarchaeota archaeon]MBU1030187.1 hypothetical protein [Nanoarchaeota archaeon]MBU1849871.1 hypothetical protein [Nanoarchaeota archaeon]
MNERKGINTVIQNSMNNYLDPILIYTINLDSQNTIISKHTETIIDDVISNLLKQQTKQSEKEKSKADIKNYSTPKNYDLQQPKYGLLKEDKQYFFSPVKFTIKKVPQYELGERVLGRAFLYTNEIELLETLSGHDFQEVLTHELLHLQYPNDNELIIRDKTRDRLDFSSKWN